MPADWTMVVTSLGGEKHEGTLIRWKSPDELVLRDDSGSPIEIGLNELDQIHVKGVVAGEASGDWELTLNDGGRLVGCVVGQDDESVRFRCPAIGETTWPIEAIGQITRRGGSAIRFAMDCDRVVLRNGDEIRGTISVVDEKGVVVVGEDGESDEPVSWSSVTAVQFRAMNQRNAGMSPGFFIRLIDGGELVASSIEWRDGVFLLTTGDKQAMRVESTQVEWIESSNSARAWLSNVPPVHQESIPYFSTDWPLRKDVNAAGGRLGIAGVVYGRGLGMHSACRVTWRLEGQYSRLTGLVGIDDSGGPLAHADFLIRAGSVVLFEAKALRWGEPAKSVDLDVKDLAEITIEVGFGRNGDVQDRVDFVNAALRK